MPGERNAIGSHSRWYRGTRPLIPVRLDTGEGALAGSTGGLSPGRGPGYDRRVTDRGPFDPPLACPFLAFEDDRDGRAPRPDHRHRCFAEVRPAPRAIAHQERYCLTAAFATCPTFLDWARREAAAVREPSGEASRIGGPALPGGPESARDRGPVDAEGPAEGEARPRRDWAVPPPWAKEGEPGRPAAAVPPFLAGRGGGEGLAPAEAGGRRGSPDAGGWSSGPDVRESAPPAQTVPAGAARLESQAGRDVDEGLEEEIEDGVTVIDPASRRGDWRRAEVPPWERPRRYEAYPRLRTRMGLPALPPLLLAAGAVVVAALALFFIPPILLNLGGEAPASPTPSPSLASPSTAPSPTPTPAPTPLVYIVKSGDTLSKIAKEFGVTLDALIEANKDTIPNPDRINVGDRIIIPTAPPDVIPGESSPGASEEPPSESP